MATVGSYIYSPTAQMRVFARLDSIRLTVCDTASCLSCNFILTTQSSAPIHQLKLLRFCAILVPELPCKSHKRGAAISFCEACDTSIAQDKDSSLKHIEDQGRSPLRNILVVSRRISAIHS